MNRWAPENGEDSLFDARLDRGNAEVEVQPELPLEAAISRTPPGGPEPPAAAEPTLGQRLSAGLLDLAGHLAAFLVAVVGSWSLGVPPGQLSLGPLLLMMGAFSFVYHVLPLTFWGHTPGMAGVGLVARSLDGGPLTIAQAVRRWLGAIAGVATLGLAVVLAGRRSPADRLSGSRVRA